MQSLVYTRGYLYVMAGMRVDIGGDATYDMFFRETDGRFNRLAKGAANQFLRTNPGGWPEWRAADPLPAPSLPMGTPIPSGTHGQVLFNYNSTVGGGRLTFDYDSNCALTMGDGSGNSLFTLNGGEGGTQIIQYNSIGRVRFQVGIQTQAAYGNANYYMMRCNDAGAAVAINFMYVRSNGRILMGGINQPSPGHLPGAVNIQPLSAGEYGLAIRRAGAQTAHLQVWQDEGGTDLSWINKDGVWGGAAGILNWIALNRTNAWNFGADVNKGAIAFYKIALDATAGGFFTFNYGHGSTSSSLYAVLPTGGSALTGLTWMYRYGSAPLAMTFEEYQHESAKGIVENLLAHADVVDRLKAALTA